jgi:hypothetical protein
VHSHIDAGERHSQANYQGRDQEPAIEIGEISPQGEDIGGMIGGKGVGPRAAQQEMNLRENLAGTGPFDQQLQQVAHLVAEKKEEEGQEGHQSAFLSAPDQEGNPGEEQREPKIGFPGEDGHEKVKKTILQALIDQIK